LKNYGTCLVQTWLRTKLGMNGSRMIFMLLSSN